MSALSAGRAEQGGEVSGGGWEVFKNQLCSRSSDVQHLPISVVKIFPWWPALSYLRGAPERGVGERLAGAHRCIHFPRHIGNGHP